MASERVYLAQCREYDSRRIGHILADGIGWLGVAIPRGGKVLVKPNVLAAHPPERHITTHPVLVEAMVKLLLDNRNEVVIADSSCIPGRTAHALDASGIAALASRSDGVTVRPFEEFSTRRYTDPANRFLHAVNLARILDDVDGIINLPKLKSHTLTRFTGAVKNLLGCIPGGGKQQAHVIAPSGEQFSELLVDLYGFLKSKILLNVMDGVVGLDGFGPGTMGKRNPAGFIGIGSEAVALDSACGATFRTDPKKIWTNRFAVERGLSDGAFTVNQELAPVRFRLPSPVPFHAFLSRHIAGLQRRRPTVIRQHCQHCGVCAEVCPVTCIAMRDQPVWDYARCIYCYCCHESCPHAAIRLRFSLR